MTAKFKTVQIRAEVKEKLDYIARMLQKDKNQVISELIVPIWRQVKQLEEKGFSAVNLKVIYDPLTCSFVIEFVPSESVRIKA